MNLQNYIEFVIIIPTVIMSYILAMKIYWKLRSICPYRVNCWFCNQNFWIKIPDSNSWTCPSCEQYNGFTKDGDYNKLLFSSSEATLKTNKAFRRSEPKNGLCKMCNINQQLKITQLANFVPMNEKNFDEEVEIYRQKLEKAYKLCSQCKKVLQKTLHKNAKTFLGTKLTQSNKLDKTNIKNLSPKLESFIKTNSMIISGILLVLTIIEVIQCISNDNSWLKSLTNSKKLVLNMTDRIWTIAKTKTLTIFPELEELASYIYDNTYIQYTMNIDFNKYVYLASLFGVTQKIICSLGCLLQIVIHLYNVIPSKWTYVIDLLWLTIMILAIKGNVDPVIISLFKLFCVVTVFYLYCTPKRKATQTPIKKTPPRKMKNLINGTMNSFVNDDSSDLDTDEDVSLNKFGIHNFSDSSNETINGLNHSISSGRAFTPRHDSIWKQSPNPTFCANSVLSKSPVIDNVFAKPSFNTFQKSSKYDSDSDLDESINLLKISSRKPNHTTNPVFTLKRYVPTPSFLAPSVAPLQNRPLISPSKLNSTSWVAGGYWGTDNRNLFNINGSRSSSQSSGFESQTSSNQRNPFSQPPSRDESVFGEYRNNIDRFQNVNMYSPSNFGVSPQNYSNIHVPQPRLASQNNLFSNYSHSVSESLYKTPGGSSLIKLPH